ncbi:MAG: ribulose-phosphate 3-epimerase [Bacilli bacterium]|nr:ribulose-phosphate 3-epimerase [Bacilli bacterium]
MKRPIISPSVLDADFLHFENEVQKIKDAGLEWIHFDVMDGTFVNNISFGNLFLKSVCPKIDLFKDVHVMIANPLEMVEKFKEAGADCLTFHYEACQNDQEIFDVIDKIHDFNMKAGIAIRPSVSIEEIYPFLSKVDLVLVMSVEPGYGGQHFVESSLDRIAKVKNEIVSNGYNVLVSVDGGINDTIAPKCLNNGADVLVVGQYLFNHSDFKDRVERLLK